MASLQTCLVNVLVYCLFKLPGYYSLGMSRILSSHRTGLFCSFFSFWPFSSEQSPGIISATSLFVLMDWLLCSVEPKLQFRRSPPLTTGASRGRRAQHPSSRPALQPREMPRRCSVCDRGLSSLGQYQQHKAGR